MVQFRTPLLPKNPRGKLHGSGNTSTETRLLQNLDWDQEDLRMCAKYLRPTVLCVEKKVSPTRHSTVSNLLQPTTPVTAPAMKGSTRDLVDHLRACHNLHPSKVTEEVAPSSHGTDIRGHLQRRCALPTEHTLENTRFITLRAILGNDWSFRVVEASSMVDWVGYFNPLAPVFLETAATYRTTVLHQTYSGCFDALKVVSFFYFLCFF